MKNLKHILGTLLVTTLVFTSCNKDNDDAITPNTRATAAEFDNLQQTALDNLTQTFEINASDGYITLESEKGVQISLSTNCLTLNGDPVTGTVILEYVELFDKGNMLITNKPTMGVQPDGDKALLISGGEFFVSATQNGQILETSCGYMLVIPADLTGGEDNTMTAWTGVFDEDGDLAWEEDIRDPIGVNGGLEIGGGQYYGFFNEFGWSNVDRFYNDPRPKTTILVAVPNGYNGENSSVYLSYDGEDAGLAMLDTFDPLTGLFSEHYGEIPIGLECHVIFATEEGDNWKYAIKAATIAENGIITITEGETSIATEAQLTAIINALP